MISLRTWAAIAYTAVAALSCGDPPPLTVAVVFNGEGEVGARIAAAEINASGGIRGRPLVLRIESETGSSARAAVVTAETLAQDKSVLAVVGHSNSNASLAASRVYNDHGIVQIAPTSSAQALSSTGPYTFRLVASDIHQARFLAQQIKVTAASPRVAVMFVNDDYGKSLFAELRAQLGASAIVFDGSYSSTDSLPGAASMARAIAAARPTHLVWLGRPPHLRQLLRHLRRLLPALDVLASDGVDQPEVAANAGGDFSGVRYVCFVNIESERPAFATLRDLYRRRTGRVITTDAALSFDAVMLIAHAARDTRPQRDDIRDYLQSLGRERTAYHGATADIRFDASGDATPSYCLREVAGNGAHTVVAAEQAP